MNIGGAVLLEHIRYFKSKPLGNGQIISIDVLVMIIPVFIKS